MDHSDQTGTGDDRYRVNLEVRAAYARASCARLIFEAIAEEHDVEVAPKKSYVSLRRAKQFALIQPSTRTRVDLGINLKGKEPTGRLEASGSFNAMVSHRVRLESAGDVDADVKRWLKEAYEAAG